MRLTRRRGRSAVVCAIALLGVTVGVAHSSVTADQMGEAAAMCVAVLAVGAAVSSLPALAVRVPLRRAPLDLRRPRTAAQLQLVVAHAARGDPALLQVFRR